jgi:ABC-2 type transport system ATP-binding protein
MAPPLQLEGISKWYGQVLGISNISLTIQGGVVGLLGPNGAGKSTLMKVVAGLVRPSRGRATLFGIDAGADEARRRLGYCPEHEGVWEELSALELVTLLARLSGVPAGEAPRRARDALVALGLEKAMTRRLAGYSKGMRQRAKLAQALVHDPDLLLLDEPLTGCDPVARSQILARIQELARAGKTILVSSHVLYEIEALTREIVVIHRGQVLAEGNVYRIRELIDRHPHRVRVECDRPRDLARRLVGEDHVTRLEVKDGTVMVETRQPDRLYDLLPACALDDGIAIRSLTSPDNNMQAVFEYLTSRERP